MTSLRPIAARPPKPRAKVQSPLLALVSSSSQRGAEDVLTKKPFVWTPPKVMRKVDEKPVRGHWRARFRLVVIRLERVFHLPPERVSEDVWRSLFKYESREKAREMYDRTLIATMPLLCAHVAVGNLGGMPEWIDADFFPEDAP